MLIKFSKITHFCDLLNMYKAFSSNHFYCWLCKINIAERARETQITTTELFVTKMLHMFAEFRKQMIRGCFNWLQKLVTEANMQLRGDWSSYNVWPHVVGYHCYRCSYDTVDALGTETRHSFCEHCRDERSNRTKGTSRMISHDTRWKYDVIFYCCALSS